MLVLSGEKAVIRSRVRIEKFNEHMELEDIHESDAPTYEDTTKQIPEKETLIKEKL